MKKCSSCSIMIEDDANECRYCGAGQNDSPQIPVASPPPARAPQVEPAIQKQTTPPIKQGALGVANVIVKVIAIVFVVGIVIGVIATQDCSSTSSGVDRAQGKKVTAASSSTKKLADEELAKLVKQMDEEFERETAKLDKQDQEIELRERRAEEAEPLQEKLRAVSGKSEMVLTQREFKATFGLPSEVRRFEAYEYLHYPKPFATVQVHVEGKFVANIYPNMSIDEVIAQYRTLQSRN